MKKILIVVSVLLVALVIFGAGFVFSQYQSVSAAGLPQGFGPGGMGPGGMMGGRGGYGPMHAYVEQALADKLEMTKADLETQLSSGKSMYQIALDKGIAEADVPALLTEVHKTAFAKAVAGGILTQAQADAMFQRMSATGFNYSNCPMGGARPQDGTGFRRGPGGGMMGSGRWNQQPAATQTAP